MFLFKIMVVVAVLASLTTVILIIIGSATNALTPALAITALTTACTAVSWTLVAILAVRIRVRLVDERVNEVQADQHILVLDPRSRFRGARTPRGVH